MDEQENLPDLPLELQPPLDLDDPRAKDTDELQASDVITQAEMELIHRVDLLVRTTALEMKLRLDRGARVEPGIRRPSRAGLNQQAKPRIKMVTDPDSSLDVAADILREQQQQTPAAPPANQARERRRAPQPTITIAGLKRKYWLQLLANVDIATPKGQKEVLLFIDTMKAETRRLIAAHRDRMELYECWKIGDHLRLVARLHREYLLLRTALILHQHDLGNWRGCVADRGTRILALREQLLPADA